MPYLTPDSAPSGRICRKISIPADSTWLALVNGALSELFKVRNWEKFGSLTPEETAAFFLDLYEDYSGSECMVFPIGMISAFPYPSSELDTGWFLCDGQAIDRTAYAELFAKVGTHYGVGDGTTTFNLPDLRAAFIRMGATDEWYVPDGVAAGGGMDTVALSVPEMPLHNHQQKMRNGNAMLVAGGSTNRFSVTSTNEFNLTTPITTFDAGEGAAHENKPPYINLIYAIYAGV